MPEVQPNASCSAEQCAAHQSAVTAAAAIFLNCLFFFSRQASHASGLQPVASSHFSMPPVHAIFKKAGVNSKRTRSGQAGGS